MNEDPRVVAQDFLDRQGEATAAGDLEATLEWCDLPCTLENADGATVVTDKEEMRAICSAFINNLKARYLTDMVRRCLDASFQDPDTILATYQTQYLSEGKLLREEPYAGSVVLKRRDGGWKISAMKFAAKGDSPVNATLRRRMPL